MLEPAAAAADGRPREAASSICNRNRIMTGVRFLFRVTLRRHDLAAEVWHIKEPQKLPPVLSPEEGLPEIGGAGAEAVVSRLISDRG